MPRFTRSNCWKKPRTKAERVRIGAVFRVDHIFEYPSNANTDMDEREDVYSKVVRAGKRTYFFDVRSTRGKDLFLTITESKKRSHDDGGVSYEKHTIFLYKEDFEKFMDGLNNTLDELERLRRTTEPSEPADPPRTGNERGNENLPGFSDIDFDDLGKV